MLLLLSSSFVALCVLICPDPSLRCCASLLLRRRPSFFFFAVRGSGGGVCRRRPAARNSPPGPPSRPVAVDIGRQCIFVYFVVDRNKQGRCFTRASPPIASGRLRPPPVASGRLRPPPVASGHLQSTSLAKHKRDGPGVGSGGAWGGVSVGRGALFQCTNAFWRLNNRSQRGRPRLEPNPPFSFISFISFISPKSTFPGPAPSAPASPSFPSNP